MSAFQRLFWLVVDWIDYWIWGVRLRIVDALYGPEPAADVERHLDSGA